MAARTTRKMSDRHEDDLVAVLGGERTKNSGAVWNDQCDGHQTGLDQHWKFAWDGKSTLGGSVSVTRVMLTKLREQCRGLEPALPMRWYADDRLTMVDEDWIAIELETFAQMQADANAYRKVLSALTEEFEKADMAMVTPRSVLEFIRSLSAPSETVDW